MHHFLDLPNIIKYIRKYVGKTKTAIEAYKPKATSPRAYPAATAYPSLSSTLSPALLRPISPCRFFNKHLKWI